MGHRPDASRGCPTPRGETRPASRWILMTLGTLALITGVLAMHALSLGHHAGAGTAVSHPTDAHAVAHGWQQTAMSDPAPDGAGAPSHHSVLVVGLGPAATRVAQGVVVEIQCEDCLPAHGAGLMCLAVLVALSLLALGITRQTAHLKIRPDPVGLRPNGFQFARPASLTLLCISRT